MLTVTRELGTDTDLEQELSTGVESLGLPCECDCPHPPKSECPEMAATSVGLNCEDHQHEIWVCAECADHKIFNHNAWPIEQIVIIEEN